MAGPAAILLVIFFIAFLVESITEYLFGVLFQRIPVLASYSWALIYVAAVIGIAGAFVYQFDLIATLGIYIGLLMAPNWFGMLLTGIVIGRGSNFVHDLAGRFFTKITP